MNQLILNRKVESDRKIILENNIKIAVVYHIFPTYPSNMGEFMFGNLSIAGWERVQVNNYIVIILVLITASSHLHGYSHQCQSPLLKGHFSSWRYFWATRKCIQKSIDKRASGVLKLHLKPHSHSFLLYEIFLPIVILCL